MTIKLRTVIAASIPALALGLAGCETAALQQTALELDNQSQWIALDNQSLRRFGGAEKRCRVKAGLNTNDVLLDDDARFRRYASCMNYYGFELSMR